MCDREVFHHVFAGTPQDLAGHWLRSHLSGTLHGQPPWPHRRRYRHRKDRHIEGVGGVVQRYHTGEFSNRITDRNSDALIRNLADQKAVDDVIADLHKNAQIEKFDIEGNKIKEPK